jgi:hypothetical protein
LDCISNGKALLLLGCKKLQMPLQQRVSRSSSKMHETQKEEGIANLKKGMQKYPTGL